MIEIPSFVLSWICGVLGGLVFVIGWHAVKIRSLEAARLGSDVRLDRLEGVRVVHEVYSDGPAIKAVTGTLLDVALNQDRVVPVNGPAGDPMAAFRPKVAEVSQ